MPGEGLILDPTSEDATNAQLDLNDGSTFALLTHDYPPPDLDSQWASSSDTEGAVLAATRHQNRTITITLRVYGGTAAGRDAACARLQQKVAKVIREGGTLKRTTSSGTVVVFDLLDARVEIPADSRFLRLNIAQATLTFTAKPYGRGGELWQVVGATNRATNPSVETNATGWAGQAGAGGTVSLNGRISPSSLGAGTVAYALRGTQGADTFIECSTASVRVACAAGNKVAVRAEVFVIDANTNVSLRFVFYNAGGSIILDTAGYDARTGIGPFDMSAVVTAPASTASCQVRVLMTGTTGDSFDFQVGAVLILVDPTATIASAPAYFDGDTPGSRWTGTRHASTSERLDWVATGTGSQVTHTETTLPALAFNAAGVPGDVSALGRLTAIEAQGVDQAFLAWGLQSRYLDPSPSAALFHEAEALTPQGGAAVAAVTGASGGSAVHQGSLTATPQSMLSTQISGGSHLSHVGDYRVLARVKLSGVGPYTLALAWSTGDFRRFTTNVGLRQSPSANQPTGFFWVDFGQVHLPQATTGAQQWEGRIIASAAMSSAIVGAQDAYVDALMLIPTTEGSGQAIAIPQFSVATVFAAHDEFNQTVGALTGKTAADGSTWAGAGSTNDFAVALGAVLQRTAVSDDASPGPFVGRYAISGTSAAAAQIVQVDVMMNVDDGATRLGVLARYTDTNNWLMATLRGGGGFGLGVLDVHKRVGGTITHLLQQQVAWDSTAGLQSVRLQVDTAGRVYAWTFPQGSDPGEPTVAGYDSDLATGGALASGSAGIYDTHFSAAALTRTYDNFSVITPPTDAVLFASQQARVSESDVLRADAAGTTWSRPSVYEGDYLRLPAAGQEARGARLIVKASRNDPFVTDDPAIDDLSAQLTAIPRYLNTPE